MDLLGFFRFKLFALDNVNRSDFFCFFLVVVIVVIQLVDEQRKERKIILRLRCLY